VEVDLGEGREERAALASKEVGDVPEERDGCEADVEVAALEAESADGGEEELEAVDGEGGAVCPDQLHAVQCYAHVLLLLVLCNALQHGEDEGPGRAHLLPARLQHLVQPL